MSKDNFQWTADLVKEFCEYAGLRIGKKEDIRQQLDLLMEDFKQSHTPKPKADNKDWKVVQWNWSDPLTPGFKNEIHSVKRLIDGEVFSVGDELFGGKIKRLEVSLGEMLIHFEGGKYYDAVNILYAKKQKEQPMGMLDKKEQPPQCGVCGGGLVFIRGKYPNTDKREVCATCNTERLEQINEISSKSYGQAYRVK